MSTAVAPGVALVTGACSGIGLAMAHELGARGHGLVLVSHRPGPLREAADLIAAKHGVAAHALPMNLARPDAAEELFAAVSGRGVAVDILVNNAGMFFFGEVADADPVRARDVGAPRRDPLAPLHPVRPRDAGAQTRPRALRLEHPGV